MVTTAEYRNAAKGKRSKYGNRRTRGKDSAKEARRGDDLALLEKAGEISGLRAQVPMALTVNGEHIGNIVVDFVYERGGRRVFEDVKSDRFKDGRNTETDLWRWKAKHFRAQYGVEIEVWE